MTKNEMKADRLLKEVGEIAQDRRDETLNGSDDKLESFSYSANYGFGIAEITFTYTTD